MTACYPLTGRIALDGASSFYFAIEPWANSLVLASTNVLAFEANGTY
jgi:hypothetical protein